MTPEKNEEINLRRWLVSDEDLGHSRTRGLALRVLPVRSHGPQGPAAANLGQPLQRSHRPSKAQDACQPAGMASAAPQPHWLLCLPLLRGPHCPSLSTRISFTDGTFLPGLQAGGGEHSRSYGGRQAATGSPGGAGSPQRGVSSLLVALLLSRVTWLCCGSLLLCVQSKSCCRAACQPARCLVC